MNIIYLLIPLALIIAALLIWLFIWAIKSNQFDDLEGPAYKILMDDDKPQGQKNTPRKNTSEKNKQNNASLNTSSTDGISEQASAQISKRASDKNSD